MDFTKNPERNLMLHDITGEEQRWRKHVFSVTSVVTIIALSIFLFLYSLFERSYDVLPMIVILLVAIASYFINKRGSTGIATNLLVWTFLIGLFVLATINDGMYDSALRALPALFIVAAMLMDKRQLIIISFLVLLSLLTLGMLQLNHFILNPPHPGISGTDVFDLMVINCATIIVVTLIASFLRESMRKV